MKKKIFLPILLLASLFFSFVTGNAQDSRKVIVVINRADWCPLCQANGEKVMKDVIPVFNEPGVLFIMNDLTNDATKSDSKMKLEAAKVFPAVKKIAATGMLLIVDAGNGKLLEKISVAESAEKLINTIRKSCMKDKM